MVLVVADPDPEKDADEGDSKKTRKTKKPIVIDRFQFKLDVEGYLGKRRKHLVAPRREPGRACRS